MVLRPGLGTAYKKIENCQGEMLDGYSSSSMSPDPEEDGGGDQLLEIEVTPEEPEEGRPLLFQNTNKKPKNKF